MRALVIQADVSSETAVRSLFETVNREFGRLDIVVSNAGIEFFGDVGSVAGEDIDRVFAVNVKGQYFVAQEAYKYMADHGRVMLTSSISAVKVGGFWNYIISLLLSVATLLTSNENEYRASPATPSMPPPNQLCRA